MAITVRVYLALLLLAGAVRMVEVALSCRNQKRLLARGARRVREPAFPWMVIFHVAVFSGAGLEAWLLDRPFLPLLATSMALLTACCFAIRWWVIRTLADHWNVQVMAAEKLGIVSWGPYRWVRHPNYAAVFVEMLAIPLIHTAWITAFAGAPFHLILLRKRLQVEEAMLLAHPDYVREMGWKPRFIPIAGGPARGERGSVSGER